MNLPLAAILVLAFSTSFAEAHANDQRVGQPIPAVDGRVHSEVQSVETVPPDITKNATAPASSWEPTGNRPAADARKYTAAPPSVPPMFTKRPDTVHAAPNQQSAAPPRTQGRNAKVSGGLGIPSAPVASGAPATSSSPLEAHPFSITGNTSSAFSQRDSHRSSSRPKSSARAKSKKPLLGKDAAPKRKRPGELPSKERDSARQ